VSSGPPATSWHPWPDSTGGRGSCLQNVSHLSPPHVSICCRGRSCVLHLATVFPQIYLLELHPPPPIFKHCTAIHFYILIGYHHLGDRELEEGWVGGWGGGGITHGDSRTQGMQGGWRCPIPFRDGSRSLALDRCKHRSFLGRLSLQNSRSSRTVVM